MEIPLWVDRRPVELSEKAQPRKVKPLEDEKDQQEVGQIVKDIETPRLNQVFPVQPCDLPEHQILSESRCKKGSDTWISPYRIQLSE